MEEMNERVERSIREHFEKWSEAMDSRRLSNRYSKILKKRLGVDYFGIVEYAKEHLKNTSVIEPIRGRVMFYPKEYVEGLASKERYYLELNGSLRDYEAALSLAKPSK